MMLEIGDFILSPRPRYSIEVVDLIPQVPTVDSSGCCVTGGMIQSWEIILKIYFISHGDITASRRNYIRMEEFLAELCGVLPQKLSLQYCTEEPWEQYIAKGYMKPIDIDRFQHGCCDSNSFGGEIHLFSVDIETGAELSLLDLEVLNG